MGSERCVFGTLPPSGALVAVRIGFGIRHGAKPPERELLGLNSGPLEASASLGGGTGRPIAQHSSTATSGGT
eukprot:14527708-Alexandrium_andersonii.AAC.1